MPEPPPVRRGSLLLSLVLHSLALAVLGMTTRPERMGVETVYEVSLRPPAPPPAILPPLDGMLPAEPEPGEARPNGQGEECPYWTDVRSRIERELWRDRRVAGGLAQTETVLVRIEISAGGELVRMEVLTPGASPALIRAVVDAIEHSAPFPAVHAESGRTVPLTVILPVRFVAA